ncbi:O-antigen ligase family protein [Spongorhabdus nitratireducens]
MTYHKTLFWLFLAILFWLPLPSASKPEWAMGLLAALSYLLAGLWLIGFALGRLELSEAFRRTQWLHIGFLFFCCWVWLQQVPLPVEWVNPVSPTSVSIQNTAALALQLPSPEYATLSIDPHATRLSAMLTLAYYLLFFMTLLLVTDSSKAKLFAWLFVIQGTFQAVFGSLSTLSGMEMLLFSAKETYFDVATGTYVNRNSFAGGLEMMLAMGMGLLIAQLSDKKAHSWSEWLRQVLSTLMSNKVLLRTALAVMVVGLVLSRSRMGNTAFFSSLMITGLLYVVLRKRLTRGMVILFVSLIVIDTAIISQWFGLEKVVQRLEQTSINKETRPEVAEMTLNAISSDYTLTGSGGGSFYTTLPGYHNGSWHGFYDLAHNDYLQFPLEFGIPGYLILVLIVLASVWQAAQAIKQRRNTLMIGMGFASFMGILAIMIHSTVDFNLQIPANAAMFVCLMALAWVARFMPSKQ